MFDMDYMIFKFLFAIVLLMVAYGAVKSTIHSVFSTGSNSPPSAVVETVPYTVPVIHPHQ